MLFSIDNPPEKGCGAVLIDTKLAMPELGSAVASGAFGRS